MIPLLGVVEIELSWVPSILSIFLAIFHFFVIGILVAERRVLWATQGVLVFIAMQFTEDPFYEAIAAQLAAAVLFMAVLVAPVRGHWVTMPLRWVGLVSFSLYIWHYLFISILGTQTGLRALHDVSFGWSANSWARAGLFIAMVMAISVISYYLIERPGMGPLRRWLIKRFVLPRAL